MSFMVAMLNVITLLPHIVIPVVSYDVFMLSQIVHVNNEA